MELLRNWAVTFCICSFAILVFKLLCPKGNMEKSMNIVLSLFMIIALISPFANGISKEDLGIDIQSNTNELNSDTINEHSASALKTELRVLTNTALNNMGITDFELEIELEVKEDGTINVTKYNILVPTGTDSEKVKTAIQKEIGVAASVSEFSS